MSENLPVYGPTEPVGDEEHEPDVIVRVDYLMSREQIGVALGIAWAEIAGDREPESLTVVETRHEVEAWLSVQGFFALDEQMERDAQRVFPPEQQRVLHVLAAAVERAYPVQSRPQRAPGFAEEFPHVAAHLARERGEVTVTLQTLDRGQVTVEEPAWCLGHDGERPGYRADITHNGPVIAAEVETACHGPVEFLQAHLSWAPFAELQPEPFPVVAIEVDQGHDFDPAGVRAVARELRRHAERLEQVADELALLRLGGQT